MNNKNKYGFTLFEFMLVIMVLLIIIVISYPLLLYAIKSFRINAFKNSAYNVLDSVKYYVANSNFIQIPEEGISIKDLDLQLENNNFDDGVIVPLEDNQFKLLYLKKGNYCAKGTSSSIKATDQGCGALDETNPSKAYLYLKESTNNSITVVASGIDNESEIIGYEFMIDGKKYSLESSNNTYTFSNLNSGKHNIIVRITNEAGLKTTSENYEFQTKEYNSISCQEKNNIESFASLKELICKYPINDNYQYQISENGIDWNNIILNNDTYSVSVEKNKKIYTRVLSDKNIVTSTIINIENIDNTLNGAYPSLLDGMIFVTYDEKNNCWIKASNQKISWDYQNRIWANSVLVKKYADEENKDSHSRKYYLSDEAIGKKINDEDILMFYVWIPRYKYKLFNIYNKINTEQTIEIEFENNDIQKSLGSTNDSWLTHPAFSYNTEKNGFWVSKFHSSTNKSSNCYITNSVENCNNSNLNLYSLPDYNDLTNISISNASLLSNLITKENNIYGLSSDVSSHVLTNLEWGAISYLANSKYGINNLIKTNNQNYKNNLENSTTGNITGIFQMVDKNSEFVMGNYNSDSGKNESDNSGFKEFGTVDWPIIIDYYKGITSKNRILGDATGETEKWNNSTNLFVNGEYPFFIRGGSNIYNFDHSTGKENENITFRTVLTK